MKTTRDLAVSDHAVLRYLERVMGFDIDGVRAHIRGVCAPAAAIGASCVQAEGVRFMIGDNGCVSTVTPLSDLPNNTTRRRLGAKGATA